MTRLTPSVLFLSMATACGGDGGGIPSDGSVPADSGLVGTCAIEVGPAYANRDGQIVVFSRPDGALIGTALIDAGAASRDDCVDDTIITVAIQPDTGGGPGIPAFDLVSIAGVARDATVRWGFHDGRTFATTTITANPTGAPVLADRFVASIGCAIHHEVEPGVASSPMPIADSCLGTAPDSIDALVMAFDDDVSPPAPLSVSYVEDVPIDGISNIDMSSASWSPSVLMQQVTVSGFSPSPNFLLTFAELLVDSVSLWAHSGLASADLAGGATSYATPILGGLATQVALTAMMVATPGTRAHFVREYRALPASGLTLDLGGLLPRASDPIFVRQDPTSPRLEWVYDGELSAATGALAFASWTDENSDLHRWTILSPPTEQFAMPRLPEGLEAFRTNEQTIIGDLHTVIFAENWRTYAEVLVDGTIVFAAVLRYGRIGAAVPASEGRSAVVVSSM